MADGVLKVVYPQVFGHSRQLLLNKFFDLSTPSMRKGRDGEKKMENGKKQVRLRSEKLGPCDSGSSPSFGPSSFWDFVKISECPHILSFIYFEAVYIFWVIFIF